MKAVLVIDMPESCHDCKFCSENDYSECRALAIKEGKNHFNYFEYWNAQKPTWCPLRPLPEKDEEPEEDLTDYVQQDYDRMASYFYGLINGRNDVINEILGETE